MQYKKYDWKGKWTGINAFPITCFTSDLKVDYEAQRTLFRYLINDGVSGLGVNGHTGEGEALTLEERKNIVRIAQEEAKGRIPICTGIHAHNYEEGIDQAKEMEKAGVDVIMILSPSIYLFDAREAPECGIEYHKAIAKSVNLPVVMHQVYGTPDEYPTEAFVKMFKEIDNLVGVKLAGPLAPWGRYQRDLYALRAVGRDNISLFPGGNFLFTFLWGVDGAFTGYANLDCERLVALFKTVKEGKLEEAKRLNERIYPVEQALYIRPLVDLIARYKEATYIRGRIPSPRVRPPKLPLTEGNKTVIYEAVKRAKLLP